MVITTLVKRRYTLPYMTADVHINVILRRGRVTIGLVEKH
jgi:hypothetical protein